MPALPGLTARDGGALPERPPLSAQTLGILRDEAPSLVELCVAMAQRRGPEGEARLEAALARRVEIFCGASTEEASLQSLQHTRECILQAHLFLGFPAALTTLGRLQAQLHAAALTPDQEALLRLPAERPEESAAGVDFSARGAQVCGAVYGSVVDKLRSRMRALHPAVERFMLQDGYGKVLGRAEMPLCLRELCVVAILASADWPDQLHSHLRGALRVGVPEELLETSLVTSLAELAPPRREALRERLARVLESARG